MSTLNRTAHVYRFFEDAGENINRVIIWRGIKSGGWTRRVYPVADIRPASRRRLQSIVGDEKQFKFQTYPGGHIAFKYDPTPTPSHIESEAS